MYSRRRNVVPSICGTPFKATIFENPKCYPLTFRTVIYEDGTLIINEKSTDIKQNIEMHGEAKHIYDAMRADGANYVWTSEPNDLWHEIDAGEWVAESIKRVEIGSQIKPISTAYWFYGLRNCVEMDMTNLNTSKTVNMDRMFSYVGYNVSAKDAVPYLDLSMFDTSKVASMRYMFNHLYGGKVIDISSWVISPLVDTHLLFSYCDLTETIYASPAFNAPSTLEYSYFIDCNRLVGGNGSAYADLGYAASYSTYARIDNPPDEPGYFTRKE